MSEWLLCCKNMKSHVGIMFYSHVFVLKRHLDSCNIIWMSFKFSQNIRHANDFANVRVSFCNKYMGRVKRIWYLSLMRAAKVQATLRIHAVLPEPSLLAHTSSESRGTFRQKARSLAHLNGWACAVKISHDGMLEDTKLLDGAHM